MRKTIWRVLVILCSPGSTISNVSQAQISFAGDKVMLRSDEHFLQHLVNYFKEYCGPANEQYARQIKQGREKQIAMARARLAAEIAKRERRERTLGKLAL